MQREQLFGPSGTGCPGSHSAREQLHEKAVIRKPWRQPECPPGVRTGRAGHGGQRQKPRA